MHSSQAFEKHLLKWFYTGLKLFFVRVMKVVLLSLALGFVQWGDSTMYFVIGLNLF